MNYPMMKQAIRLPQRMIQRIESLSLSQRVLYLGAAVVLTVLGLLGLILPLIPGVLLLVLAVKLLTVASPHWGQWFAKWRLFRWLNDIEATVSASLKGFGLRIRSAFTFWQTRSSLYQGRNLTRWMIIGLAFGRRGLGLTREAGRWVFRFSQHLIAYAKQLFSRSVSTKAKQPAIKRLNDERSIRE